MSLDSLRQMISIYLGISARLAATEDSGISNQELLDHVSQVTPHVVLVHP